MPKGYLALVLHSHLPFVRHPEHEHFLEENWFYEALTECYVPLVEVFDRLVADGVPFRLTISLTPTLLSMLADDLLRERYRRRLNLLLDLAQKEVKRTEKDPSFHRLARMYQELLERTRHTFFVKYQGDLIQAFRRLADAGRLEIITSAATHGFLPLLAVNPEAVRAQIQVGVQTYRRFLGRDPQGFWLPECGYAPGIDTYLAEAGIRYFLVDTHGLLHASPRPRYGPYAPIFCPSGVAAFGRDAESSKQVWSATEGYPGDYEYRDFYRDIGFDLDLDYLRPYLHPEGIRIHTGFKYYRITGKTDDKAPYDPERGREKAAIHAGNFMFNREQQVKYLASIMDRPPIVVAPYDAELFGHWWFEGPQWLEFLIRKIAYDQDNVKLCTPGDYLAMFPRNQLSTPAGSSWGWKGYYEVWLNGSNDWIYRHLHKAADRMIELARDWPAADGVLRRALNQAARELLLAQSSDWPFILKTGTMVPYARRRLKEHLANFTRLYDGIRQRQIDEGFLSYLEGKHNLFPDLDYRVFAPGKSQQQAPLAHAAGAR